MKNKIDSIIKMFEDSIYQFIPSPLSKQSSQPSSTSTSSGSNTLKVKGEAEKPSSSINSTNLGEVARCLENASLALLTSPRIQLHQDSLLHSLHILFTAHILLKNKDIIDNSIIQGTEIFPKILDVYKELELNFLDSKNVYYSFFFLIDFYHSFRFFIT
jgi:hypothetical protein